MWERMGAHGDLQAVFDADPPQEIIDEMQDVDDVLAGDMWDGGNYVDALRRRRGSRSVSEYSGAAWSRDRGRGFGIRRRGTRDELVGTDFDAEEN